MKVVILAGGFGTRISEESVYRPKPMIEIGDMPILWHIMKGFSHYGLDDFIICAGYKQHVIKEWFADYFLHTSDVTFDFKQDGKMIVHNKHTESWMVTIVDTGIDTQTGGRIKRIERYIDGNEFMLTYGDAVCDINISELLSFHRRHKKIGTISMYNFAQNKGVIEASSDGTIKAFREKSDFDGDLINIGYMVFTQEVFQYIGGDDVVFENQPILELVKNNQIKGFVHKGFWQCMDTYREKKKLDELWDSGKAPWKTWD